MASRTRTPGRDIGRIEVTILAGGEIMQNKDTLGTDEYINDLCDWIDEQWALKHLMPGYFSDPADLDMEGCFV
jgi:hypothetical protein